MMKHHLYIPACIILLLPSIALAGNGWLIAASSESARSGGRLQLEVVRPDESTPWPASLRLRIVSGAAMETVTGYPDKEISGGNIRQVYIADLPREKTGLLKIELAEMPSNRLLISVADASDPIAEMMTDNRVEPPQRLDPMPDNEPALSAHEPVYFVAGIRGGFNALFQLSFKYRLFDPESLPVQLLPALAHLHFSYTQAALWDLSANSKPLHDTSYRPSLFLQSRLDKSTVGPDYLRGGYEHESNGKDGADSRSVDMLFIQPFWQKDFAGGNSLLFSPRFYGYLDRKDNPNIARYRGYTDWIIRYGDERNWVLSSRIRTGTAGKVSAQLDLSKPLRQPLFSRTGGYLYLQLFSGYGDSLLDYRQKGETQFRVGFSIVR